MSGKYGLLKLAILIAITFAALPAFAAASPDACGDADGSAAVDIDDVVYLISYIFSGGPAPDPGCCASDCPPTVMDYDGNTYFTIEIGSQCWMAQNLKVTHYLNGDPIPNVTAYGEWFSITTGAFCYYANDPAYAETYGRLYNWFAVVDSRGIAPEGWHVPTDDEWKQLEMYLGMDQAAADGLTWRGSDEGGKLKEADTTHWLDPNTGATNESGFTALPGGYRDFYQDFTNMRELSNFWTATQDESFTAFHRGLGWINPEVWRGSLWMDSGFSIRCVKD